MFNDPILNKLATIYPPPTFEDRSEFLFERLTDAIISQQLSVKAADTIFERFKKLFHSQNFPTPKQVLRLQEEKIRSAGISYAKISYIKSIAHAFNDGLINIQELKQMNDEEVIKNLTKLKGVGKWTAEMILIFTLQRPDVFSLGDLGLRRSIEKLYNISDVKKVEKLSQTWKPYRSTACWYLWRSLENKPF